MLSKFGYQKVYALSLFVLTTLATNLLLAQEAASTGAAAPAAQQPPAWMQFAPMIVVVAIFYFLILRPQAKRQKEQQSLLSALKPGDQVVTQSGILGRISSLDDKVVHLEIANNVNVKLLRSSVLGLQAEAK